MSIPNGTITTEEFINKLIERGAPINVPPNERIEIKENFEEHVGHKLSLLTKILIMIAIIINIASFLGLPIALISLIYQNTDSIDTYSSSLIIASFVMQILSGIIITFLSVWYIPNIYLNNILKILVVIFLLISIVLYLVLFINIYGNENLKIRSQFPVIIILIILILIIDTIFVFSQFLLNLRTVFKKVK